MRCKKSIGPIIIIVVMALSVFTACGGKENTEPPLPDPPIPSEPSPIPLVYITGLMNDEELVDYLLFQVPITKEMVQAGLNAIVTGEITEIDTACRDIWLVTEHEGKVTREFLYTVGKYGEIYEYSPFGDGWEILYEPWRPAFVKLGEVFEDESIEFLVDDVLWVEDDSMPNGYRLINDEEEWVPYIAHINTDCYFWGPEENSELRRYKISLANLLEELGVWQDSQFIADVITEDGNLLYISQRYLP